MDNRMVLAAACHDTYTPPKPRSPWDRGTGAGPKDGMLSMMRRLGALPVQSGAEGKKEGGR